MCVPDNVFEQLVQLVDAALREAHAGNDLVSPRILVNVVFLYYRFVNGIDDYIFVSIF